MNRLQGRDPVHPAYYRPRRIVVLIAALAALFTGSIFMASSASASSEVCVAGNSVAYACNYTHGSGGRVDSVDAIVGIPAGVTICNHRAEIRVSAYGNPRHRFWTPVNTGCSWGRSWLTSQVRESFPTGNSWVCVKNFVGGTQQGREICIKLT